MKTINDFIKQLQAVSSDKRELPLVITAPNGTQCYPEIKMQVMEGTMFTEGVKVEKMVITWA
jgi:hypothetical protein